MSAPQSIRALTRVGVASRPPARWHHRQYMTPRDAARMPGYRVRYQLALDAAYACEHRARELHTARRFDLAIAAWNRAHWYRAIARTILRTALEQLRGLVVEHVERERVAA